MNIQVKSQISLIISLIISLVSGGILLTVPNPFVRIPVGIGVIFILPGYMFLKVLWPPHTKQGPDGLWRLIMIFPTSITLVGGILLLVNYFDTYSYNYLIILLTFLNVILAPIALLRDEPVFLDKDQIGKWFLALQDKWRDYQPTGWHVFLTLAFLMLLSSVVYAVMAPKQTQTLTEFYVLTPNGDLPLSITKPEFSELELKFGIKNREGRTVNYQMMIIVKNDHVIYEVWSDSITVANNTTVEQPLRLDWPSESTDELQFLLFMDDSYIPYRSLRVILDNSVSVTPNNDTYAQIENSIIHFYMVPQLKTRESL